MTLRFAENFTGYGTSSTGRTNMLAGVWADVGTQFSPSTSNPRGLGSAHGRTGVIGVSAFARFVYGGTFTEITMGAAFSLPNLPTTNNTLYLFQPRDGANSPQVSLTVTTTGVLQLRQGVSSTVLADSDALTSGVPPIVAGAYQFIEMYVKIGNGASPADGAVEVRVDGVTVIDTDTIDTQATANVGSSQAVVASSGVGSGVTSLDIADLYMCDGYQFLGDTQWIDVLPNADGANSDWTRNTGATDYDAIDDTTPDGDTTYIAATTAAQVSDFGLQDLSGTVSEVVAVISKHMTRKTDAGSANVRASIVSTLGSPDSVSDGASNPMTEAYTYYRDIFLTDPGTGVAWTPAGVNAAQLRLTKTV